MPRGSKSVEWGRGRGSRADEEGPVEGVRRPPPRSGHHQGAVVGTDAERQRQRGHRAVRGTADHRRAGGELAAHPLRPERPERHVVQRVVADLEPVLVQPPEGAPAPGLGERVAVDVERRRRGEARVARCDLEKDRHRGARHRPVPSVERELGGRGVVEGEHDGVGPGRQVDASRRVVGRGDRDVALPGQPLELGPERPRRDVVDAPGPPHELVVHQHRHLAELVGGDRRRRRRRGRRGRRRGRPGRRRCAAGRRRGGLGRRGHVPAAPRLGAAARQDHAGQQGGRDQRSRRRGAGHERQPRCPTRPG